MQETGYIIKHDEHTYEIHTDIIINAAPEQVWAVLTDFAAMPNWSSTFKGIEGRLKHGGQVYSLYQNGDEYVKAPHTVYVVDGVKFWWSDEFNVIAGMRDNHHYIVNDAGNGQTRFIQKDTHTGRGQLQLSDGTQIPMNAQILTASQLEPFMQFNRELKAECERHFTDF